MIGDPVTLDRLNHLFSPSFMQSRAEYLAFWYKFGAALVTAGLAWLALWGRDE